MERRGDGDPPLIAQLTDQIYELLTGRALSLKGSPPELGAPRFMLRQIINLCGAIPDTMIQTGSNVDSLRDYELTRTIPPRTRELTVR